MDCRERVLRVPGVVFSVMKWHECVLGVFWTDKGTSLTVVDEGLMPLYPVGQVNVLHVACKYLICKGQGMNMLCLSPSYKLDGNHSPLKLCLKHTITEWNAHLHNTNTVQHQYQHTTFEHFKASHVLTWQHSPWLTFVDAWFTAAKPAGQLKLAHVSSQQLAWWRESFTLRTRLIN